MDYVAIKLKSVLDEDVASNDVYIRLESDKFIKLWRKGQPVDKERLARYESQNIDTVYVTRDDFERFSISCLKVGAAVANNPNISSIKKVAVITQVASTVMAGFADREFDERALKDSENLVNSLVTSVGDDLGLESLVDSFENMGEDFVKYSVAVSTVSVMLAQSMGWTSSRTLKFIGLGALFHDIGFKELPTEVYGKRRVDMDAEEIEKYESHPSRGAKILNSVKTTPIEVINIVQDSHEEYTGGGFPRGLSGDKISPLSRVIFFAEHIVEEMMPKDKTIAPKTAKKAILLIMNLFAHDIRPDMEDGLKKLGNI